MTAAQRDLIASPVAGLVVYCTNCGASGELEAHNGNSWKNIIGATTTTVPLAIGQSYQGGIIVYVLLPGGPGYDANTLHGLIAPLTDQSTATQWGCQGIAISGADGIALGTGNQNTTDIVNGCATAGIAARLCYDLVLNGYSDWYLPSQDELRKMVDNQIVIGGLSVT